MGDKVSDKIELAIDMCKGIWCYDTDNIFKYIYPFTTENIAGYLDLFDLNDKSLLTVGSSGDQVLNAILRGSKDISVFDICPFACEYFNLKKAGIQAFNREEFLKFFCYNHYMPNYKNNSHAFDNKQYMRLKETLRCNSDEVYHFWDELFIKYNGLRIRRRLFNLDESRFNSLCVMNEYLKSDLVYNELKNKIDNVSVTFEIGNIFDFDSERNYDNIYLSNIGDYYSIIELRKLFDKLLNYLNDDGKMLITYLYGTDINTPYSLDEKEIYDLEKLFLMFSKEINLDSFVGTRGIKYFDSNIKDSVITYKKVKKI